MSFAQAFALTVSPVVEGGVLGPKTLAAAGAADPATLHATLGWLREARYRSLSDFPTFGHGWIIRLCRVIAATAAFT